MQKEKNLLNLEGKLLVASPQMADKRFSQSVIYMCSHTTNGAMGLTINKPTDILNFKQILEKLNINYINNKKIFETPVFMGGPVEYDRGFVLHSSEYILENSNRVNKNFAVTSNSDILMDIARGGGPHHSLFAIGYAGWTSGQIEYELQEDSWIIVNADEEIVFGNDNENKWTKALSKVGKTIKNVTIASLSSTSGNA